MQRVTAYQTSDGQIFECAGKAADHEFRLVARDIIKGCHLVTDDRENVIQAMHARRHDLLKAAQLLVSMDTERS